MPRRLLALLLLLLVWTGSALAQAPTPAHASITVPILESRDVFHPVYAEHGMVASQKAEATRVGLEILQRGGNAVDAAVATAFALAVVLPRAGNLGGGGFMMIHDAKSGETVALDYREMAPRAAHRDLFLDAEGNVDRDKATESYLAAAVPGTVAGLAHALERWGTMEFADVLAPAIALAREGFPITADTAGLLDERREVFARWPATARQFLKADGTAPDFGEILRQPDLARTLERIAEHGTKEFYEGETADLLVADMERHGGLITHEDLKRYKVVERRPVRGTYRGYEILSMPPPSSGGVHLIQMLNILEGFPLAHLGQGSAESIHLVAEAMKLAFADRSLHLGDPDHWPVPVAGLTSRAYADMQRAGIDRFRARPSAEIGPGNPLGYESPDTTHFSIVDRQGNAVACTTTLNSSYGSGIVAEGTGFLLNNEMDDFSSKPGSPNAYGLLGAEANAIEPTKRPLSSMTPTLVLKGGEVYLVTGSPGGSRIITTTLQVVLNVLEHGMNIAAATNAPRVHHQWYPDELRIEVGLSPDTIQLLAARGHRVVVKDAMGSTQSIMRTGEGLFGASDPRRPDALTLGH